MGNDRDISLLKADDGLLKNVVCIGDALVLAQMLQP